MKKTLLLASLLLGGAFSMNAQTTVLTEGFQDTTFPPTNWSLNQNNPSQTWSRIASVNDPTNFIAQVQYDENLIQQDEWLITPSLDLSGFEQISLEFKLGMSYYWGVNPNDNYDALIKVSVDGGNTWTQIWNEDVLGTFTNFTMNNVNLDISTYNQNDVKIAFQYYGVDGAQLLLDDIVVTGTEGASVDSPLANSFSVYPNPAKDMLNISNSIGAELLSVTVTDLNGRTVKQINSSVEQINISDLNAGVYFVNINSNEGSLTKKIVKK